MNYIGLAKECKQFILLLSKMTGETKQIVYKSTKSPKQLAECQMVYEILTKLRTSTYIFNRKFGKGNVPATTKNFKTKLSNAKLENEILGSRSLVFNSEQR